ATIKGPQGSIWEYGVFHLLIDIPPKYPEYPPKASFLTRILHPNVNRWGEVCERETRPIPQNIVETMCWHPAMTIAMVVASANSLLISP
ncbi:ubiquitin-conjugating enzyme/RWD-like protein, partial [Stachybotrys elegans]